MRKINLLSFIALGAVLTSCQKEEFHLENGANIGKSIDVTINAEYAPNESENGTKSSIGADGMFNWINGDQLHVFNGAYDHPGTTGYAGVKFQHKGAGGFSVSFTGTLVTPETPSHLTMIYPYNSTQQFKYAANGSAVRRDQEVPVIQTLAYDANGVGKPESVGKYAYMAGKTRDVWDNTAEVGNVKMSHLMSFIDFELLDVPIGTNIGALTVTSDKKFSDYMYIFIPTAGNPYVQGSAKKVETITAELINNSGEKGITIVDGSPLKVRLTILSGLVKSEVWTIKLEDPYGREIYTATREFDDSGKKYDMGKYYQAPINFTALPSATPTVVTLDESTPSLEKAMAAMAALAPINKVTITKLKVIGTALTNEDLTYAFTMASLKDLDISETATIELPYRNDNTSANAKNNTLEYITLPENLTKIGRASLKRLLSLKRVVFKGDSKLATVEAFAFSESGITEIYLPQTLTTLNLSSFQYCKKLKKVTFHPESTINSSHTIMTRTFQACDLLTEVNFPETLKGVQALAFLQCINLPSLTFPESLDTLGAEVFAKCNKLTTITFLGVAPPAIHAGNASSTLDVSLNTFGGNSTNPRPPLTSIIVPHGCKQAYMDKWNGTDAVSVEIRTLIVEAEE